MKIYADVLIVTNCLVTLAYLQATAMLTRRSAAGGRLFAGCIFGGMLSLLICADGSSFWGAMAVTAAKAAGVALTLLIGLKFHSVGDFVRCLAVHLAVRAAFMGLMLICWELSDSKRIYVRNYTVYLDISLLRLAAAIIGAYALLWLFEQILRRSRLRSVRYEAVFRSGDYEVRLPAVADTGNRLCDSFTGLPVVIFCCSDMYLHYSLDSPSMGAGSGFRLTPYSTIDGSGLLPVTTKGRVTITDDRGNQRELRCCVGVRPSAESKSRAIFDPELLS